MMNVFVHVLKTVIAHTSNEEPAPDVFVLFESQWGLALSTAVNVDASKVARELSFVLCNQTPFRSFFSFNTFNKEPANFVSSKFKPEHVVREIQIQVVLI